MLDEVDEVSILGAVLGLLVGKLLGNGEGMLNSTTLGGEYELENSIVEGMLDGTLVSRVR